MVIVSGRDLTPMDRSGSSDPYVRVIQNGRCVRKTEIKKRTLNPVWNSEVELFLEHQSVLQFQVYDRDRIAADDFLGCTEIDLGSLDSGYRQEESFPLEPGS